MAAAKETGRKDAESAKENAKVSNRKRRPRSYIIPILSLRSLRLCGLFDLLPRQGDPQVERLRRDTVQHLHLGAAKVAVALDPVLDEPRRHRFLRHQKE